MKHKNLTLRQGNAFELIKKIPDHSIDLILTDPPYNLASYSTGNLEFSWRTTVNNDLAKWDEVPFDPKDLAEEFLRVLKPTWNLFVFTSYNLIGKYHEVFDSEFDTFQFMAWHKANPIPNFFKKGFLNSVELIVTCWNKGHTWNFKTQKEMHNFFESGICMGKERLKWEDWATLHPTQKPLKLLRHLVDIASSPGQVILDPFMWVGSTGVAALEGGRTFVWFELEENYFKAAKERLSVLEKGLFW